jgi:hypothetical protein
MPFDDTHGHNPDAAEGPVFSWALKSSRVVAGQSPTYTVLLYRDGCMSCDCPSWLYQLKKDANGDKRVRTCKHTEGINPEEIAEALSREGRIETAVAETVQRLRPTGAAASVLPRNVAGRPATVRSPSEQAPKKPKGRGQACDV